ncbi:uncharacterized protein LOC107325889 isoform X3 [Coturnix japonica]|uniref:uncharacterized protein LOC107325889 isoform X3 n=1 Tax=Coturnix japonica TaxID=93934 RepID=UPI0007771F3E|nr:uncharacterized protein LOC107325889 isoform X3 [Coturnix japonica]
MGTHGGRAGDDVCWGEHQPSRSYCYSGFSLVPPNPIILPGHTGCCTFNKTTGSFRGSVGVLVYEAETFTLAILFSNPFDYNLYSIEFAAEISPEKAHVGQLQDVYNRMYGRLPANPNNRDMFQFTKLSDTQETLIVSAGGTKVTATMSTAVNSIIKVVVENQ